MNEVPWPFRYKGGYLGLPLSNTWFEKLPQTITVDGQVLLKKEEFHVTITNIAFLANSINQADAENRFIGAFSSCVARNPISFGGFINEFRQAAEDERVSLIIRCDVRGIDEVFNAFDGTFSRTFDRQPTHVTLYTLQSGKGIGINTEAQMQKYRKVEFPELFGILPK